MLTDLIRALPAAVLFCVAPGWFWATLLRGKADLPERLIFSTAFSMALVPPVALVLARLSGTGITLVVAALSALTVFATGLAARLMFGVGKRSGDLLLAPPAPLGLPTLTLLSLALALMVWARVASPEAGWYVLATALLVILAGAAGWLDACSSAPPEPSAGSSSALGSTARWLLLSGVLVGVIVRGYAGPVLHDWPYLRGGDQFSHGVMANEMLSQGHYDAYLVYPPGFHILTAGVSSLSGLEPLEVFPVLAPALILLPALACYALGKELWGWQGGVAAAAFSGLILGGTWANIEQARYPNLVSAQFLLVLAVAALVRLYRSPSPRSVISLALLGSSVVLYHSVGSFYTALLLALVAVLFLPYLLLRRRPEGIALLLSLALLGVLSILFAWDTYDLNRLIGGLSTGSTTGPGGEAVSIVIGTQPAFDLQGLPERISPPLFWLGLLGALLLLAPNRGRNDLPELLSRATLFLWCAILFVGSRTVLSGFPQRFERDLGIPLSVLAAFTLVAVLRSLTLHQRDSGVAQSTVRAAAAAVASVLALSLVGIGAWKGIEDAASPAPATLLTPDLVAVGEWLKEHNTGGKIVPTPSYGAIPSRGMLALGGYDGLQSYPERRVRTPRSLPPGGAQEIEAARWLLLHPQSERAKRIVKRYDIRYVVLSKSYPGIDPRAFQARPNLYRKEFENRSTVVFAPRDTS